MDKEVLEKVEVTTSAKTKKEVQKEDYICAYPPISKKKEMETPKNLEEKTSKEISQSLDKKFSLQADLKKEPESEPLSEYLSSFKNLTLKDVKREEAKIAPAEISSEDIESKEEMKEVDVPKVQEEKKAKKTTLIIEKPNYDLMPKKKGAAKKRKKLKTALLACALAVCSIGAVAGSVVCDNLNSHYMQLEDGYNLNLISYINKINNLNATNKGFEFIETYPEDINEISSIGERTNWFDNLVNFITGVFGG